MIDRLFNSIVFRIGSMMFVISFVSILSMFSSVFISELADQDALAINHAGSLRMQSYKILASVELLPMVQEANTTSLKQEVQGALAIFDEKLAAPVLKQSFHQSSSSSLQTQLLEASALWQSEVKPTLVGLLDQKNIQIGELVKLKLQFDAFVMQLDHLVSLYQQHAESRILLIRMIQGVSLFTTVILIAIIMIQLNRRVEKPLSELTDSAKRIIAGDYTAHTHIVQNDELGFLSKTMNQMADSIAESHVNLEKRVRQKTKELRQSKDSLEILYETSSLLSQPSDNLDLNPIIKKLSKISGLNDLDLCLMTSEGSAPYEHILTTEKMLDEQCQTGDCGTCITEAVSCANDTMSSDTLVMRYPLMKGDINYGVLICNLSKGSSLAAWQHQLLQSITNQIATGLKLRQQADQGRRITLINERTVIARELHDSLAQALSYLKIQVTRLQKLQQRDASAEQIDGVIIELKSGLSSAYRQLRELLTTFRLKIDDNGIKSAFEKTVAQLNERAEGKIEFTLNYQISDLPLSPNEEIHVMQIAREATQNVLHHSHASHAQINLFLDQDDKIHLEIRDNGVGIPNDPEKLNHYGLAIMKERANHLGGQLHVKSNSPSGTYLELIFPPSYNHKVLNLSELKIVT